MVRLYGNYNDIPTTYIIIIVGQARHRNTIHFPPHNVNGLTTFLRYIQFLPLAAPPHPPSTSIICRPETPNIVRLLVTFPLPPLTPPHLSLVEQNEWLGEDRRGRFYEGLH